MVKEIKAGASKVKQVSEVAFSLVASITLAAAFVKLATQPLVNSGLGQLPVWQIAAGVLAAVLVCKLWKLHSNER
jgi:hypothetical protein